MKILLIGDLHIKKANLDVVKKVLEKCRLLVSKCDLTIFMGDVNDSKAIIRSETISLCMNILPKWPTPIIVLCGNHDMNNSIAPEDGHSLEFMYLLDNVRVIDKPEVIVLNPLTLEKKEKLSLGFVPYMPEEKFLKVNLPKTNYLFLHQDMDFAKYSSQASTGSIIKAESFKDYKKVFVGHIHLPQEYKNIIYVGTPYTESFKESDEEKRVIIYDTDTDKVLSIPLGVRQHVTFNYTIMALKDIKDIKKDLDTKIKKGQIVRVIITAPEEIESKIKRSLFKGYDIMLKTKKILNTNKKVLVSDSMSNTEIMETYLKQVQIDDALLVNVLKFNKEILRDIG